MKILYFAAFRERLNRAEEEVSPPAAVQTVGALIDWLAEQDEAAHFAFSDRRLVRTALDGRMVAHTAPLTGANVVALMPPMTGG